MRAACRDVAQAARHVLIDADGIASYARSLPAPMETGAGHDSEAHYLGHGEGTVAFFVTLSAVNFGSGYFPLLRKPTGRSGYFTVASSLAEHFRRRGPLPADSLEVLTPERCTELFGQRGAPPEVSELMALFARSLRDLGALLRARFGGRAGALVEAAQGRAERLVSFLTEMPLFRDVARYADREVPFYKRAQLLAADLSLAFQGEGPGRFEDLERLTIFADNVVPHVLRVDGILRYEPRLLARIEAGELLPAGSQEEVEIRACALEACERIVEARRRAGEPTTAASLDALLWNRGRGAAYKALPRHRTRTVSY